MALMRSQIPARGSGESFDSGGVSHDISGWNVELTDHVSKAHGGQLGRQRFGQRPRGGPSTRLGSPKAIAALATTVEGSREVM
jgi:hypothetical protein